MPHHRPERTCERGGCAPREKREETTEATPAYHLGAGNALRPYPLLKPREGGKADEAEVSKSELEPKYGSYGFTPSGIPFVIATSRPVGYSPGGAPGRVREERGREGGFGRRKEGPLGVGPRRLYASQLRSSHRPSTPGTQLKDT